MNSAITPRKIYWRTWAALMSLLLLTWGSAQFNFGPANTIISLLIAGVKMLLVMMFFMQLRYHPRITWVFAAAGMVWLLIMITMTLGDYLTRERVSLPNPPGAIQRFD